MIPYCPECGSVKIKLSIYFAKCLEKYCGYAGIKDKFTNHLGSSKSSNKNWRDPIALLPGDYGDNQ